MNCEHETLIGDSDLFQLLLIEYKYIDYADIPVSGIHLLYAHLKEYLPLMAHVYAMQTINCLLADIKRQEVEEETLGTGSFNYVTNLHMWDKIKNFLKTEKDKRLAESGGEE